MIARPDSTSDCVGVWIKQAPRRRIARNIEAKLNKGAVGGVRLVPLEGGALCGKASVGHWGTNSRYGLRSGRWLKSEW